jgi:Ran-binding protein 3
LGGGFGGSTGFGGFGGAKSGSSFASTPGNLEIKGLKQKDKPFGAAALGEPSDDEDGDEDEDENDTEKEERQSSVPLLSQQRMLILSTTCHNTDSLIAPETGEEGEMTIWTGRSKLYVMGGEGSSRGWKERGQGVFKFNITVDEPKKARFVLRADGTHKLLLNAAVTPALVFGGDAQGEKPKDGRLLFNAPTPDGGIEMNLLKMKAENAVKLWEEVAKVQEQEL